MYALSKIVFWPDGAQATMEVTAVDHVIQFLKSPDAEVRKWTCYTVGDLSLHQPTAIAILAIKACSKLVDLLRQVSTFCAFMMQLMVE
jgi:HEAT repeat protein